MSEQQFDLWAGLLEDRTGMTLPLQRKSFLVTSLSLRMQEIACATFEDYYQILHSGANGEVEWKYLIDRLTVHETRFFRHLDSLRLVQEYAHRKSPDPKTGHITVQILSAGCSTGEESYSLAISLDQVRCRSANPFYFGVMGTDISVPSINIARTGEYNAFRLRGLPDDIRAEYFQSTDGKKFQVNEELRKRVCFTPMNILAIPHSTLGKMDIIYCQNLLIYFERGRRYEIVDSLAKLLHPGGLLILGSGELLEWGHPLMKKIHRPSTLVYRLEQVPKRK